MYHFCAYNEEWFKRHYHKGRNVDTTFSMIKEKFGTRLMSKKEVAQVNELLLRYCDLSLENYRARRLQVLVLFLLPTLDELFHLLKYTVLKV